MKKIITLLFFVGAVATSFAQNGQRQNEGNRGRNDDHYAVNDNGRYGKNDSRKYDDGRNVFSARERDFQIDRINREFNYRIQSIQNDRYMRRRDKKFAIRDAESQRARQIQMVNARFNSQFQHADGRYGNGRR